MYLLSETFMQNFRLGGDRDTTTTWKWDAVSEILKADSALRKKNPTFGNRWRKAMEETHSGKADFYTKHSKDDISNLRAWGLFAALLLLDQTLCRICDIIGIGEEV